MMGLMRSMVSLRLTNLLDYRHFHLPHFSLKNVQKKLYCISGPSQERVKLRPGQLPRHGVHQRQGVCCDHAGTQKPQIRAFGRNWLKFGPLESFSRSGLLTKFQLIPVMILLLHLSHTSLLIVSWRRREGGKCMVPF